MLYVPMMTAALQDFTTGALQWLLDSMKSLRRLATEEKCRRRAILEYFGEAPSFQGLCGTCDVCLRIIMY